MNSLIIKHSKLSSSKLYLLCLTLFFLAAWLGQSYYYIPIADDYPFRRMFENGLWNTIWEWYAKTGIRRSFSIWSNAPICASPTWLTNAILIFLHYISTILVFFVALKITRSNYLSYLAGLIFGVFPFGYGAITWACGSYTISISIFFLAGLLILLNYASGKIQSQWLAILVSGICFFLCCVCGEHYVFAIAFSGVLALAATNEGITFRGLFRPWVMAPAFVTCFYIVLILLTQSGSGLMDAGWQETSLKDSFNPRTLVSVWFYQWQHVLAMEPWFSFKTWSYTINDLGFLRLSMGVLLIIAGYLVMRNLIPKVEESSNEKSGKPIWKSELFILILMMFSIAFVHALAGGYSASSRHQYVPLVIFSIIIAACAVRIQFIDKILRWEKSFFLIFLSLIAVGTTWLVTAANRHELRSYEAICNFLAEKKIIYPISVHYSPPLFYLWPKQKNIVCPPFDEGWALNHAVEIGRNGPKVEISDYAPTKLLIHRSQSAAKISIIE
jgi:hypothetical protein